MNLQRLRQMPLTEIAGRSRQEAAKWWDRVAANASGPAPASGPTASRAQREAFRETAPTRFFAGAVEESAPALLADRMPEAARDVIAGAERVLEGRFDLLGYAGLSLGHPPDWHADAVSGKRAPLVHWSRLDPLDEAAVGDSKVVWELNRHQWLVSLGQAYRLTGDERYANAFGSHVTDWLRSNPRGQGINWASSLELAFRVIAWAWALVLFRRSPALTPELFARMRASIENHASHVERYLSVYFSPNTHLTGEALGMFYAGALLPDLGRARRWRRRALGILLGQLARQVYGDGVYFEQSAWYQRYTVEIYLHLLLLAARNGFALPAVVGQATQRMLDFLLAVRRPDGSIPQFGDSDGGCLLPLAARAPDDFRGVFSIGAAVFGRPDYAWAAGGLAPETVWLMGAAGVDAVAALAPASPARSPSEVFPQGGYAVMRTDWRLVAHQLIFDVGPLGCPLSAGHGHADLLSLQCSAFGRTFLADAGTYRYAEAPWRNFFRSTAAHSTVMVDGASQAIPAGPFAWRQHPRARLRRWLSTDDFDFADAEHDAYLRLPDPVRHRRRVLFVKPRYWVVVDDLDGRHEHHVELRFQFGAVKVALGPRLWARARAGDRGLLMCPIATVALRARLREGSTDPVEGWCSPEYGQRQPAPVVVYSVTARLPLRVFTLLLPSADPDAPVPPITPLVHDHTGPVGLVLAGDEMISIEGPDGLLVHSSMRGHA